MPPRSLSFLPNLALAATLLTVTACGGSQALKIETRAAASPVAVSPVTSAPNALAASTPEAASTTHSPSPAPQVTAAAQNSTLPTATSVPQTGVIEFKPPQLVQGGTTVVYLNENASSATLRFQDRQYPMLHDGSRWWAIVGVNAFTEPGLVAASVTYTPSGRSNSITVAASINVQRRDFPIEHIELDSETASLLDPETVAAENNQRAAIFSGFTAQRFWSGPFLTPGEGTITSIYGEGRSYNNGPVSDFHKGTDFGGNTGDPVVAAAAGRVVFTGSLRVRGGTVIIDHGAGVFTAYNHLSEIDVEEGDFVAPGESVGAIGSTGLVTGPHLHWEVVIRGVEVDGRLWLSGLEIGP